MPNEDRQMENLPANEQAKKAISHVLFQIRDVPHIGYYMGFATQSFDLLTEAYATLTARPITGIREDFLPTAPAAPSVPSVPSVPGSSGDEFGIEDDITDHMDTDDVIAYMEGLSIFDRMQLLRDLRRFCGRCGGDQIAAGPCSCRIGRRAA